MSIHGVIKKEKHVSEEVCKFGPWIITSRKGPILTSFEADTMTQHLGIPALPEMVFGDSVLRIEHVNGSGIEFNALDALRRVDTKQDSIKVAAAEQWQKLRGDSEHIKNVVKPFDWTYTTNYSGTEFGNLKVSETNEVIDIEKLKTREKINFYTDTLLFEDELADHGCAMLNVKIRVMPGSFFVLLRFFLRVDGVLIRINDTRIYHEAEWNYIIREYSSKEKAASEISNAAADPSILAEQLTKTMFKCEKLLFT